MKRGREECDEGNCLMLLTKVGKSESKAIVSEGRDSIGDLKCKTCNRRFSSFQALGGHRASHRKPKLMVTDLRCHANHDYLPSPTMKQSRMHPCPICGLEFAIGQALGGHMRKHKSAINDGLLCHNKPSLSFLNKSKDAERLNMCLDLNLTPLENEDLKLNLSMPVLKCFI